MTLHVRIEHASPGYPARVAVLQGGAPCFLSAGQNVLPALYEGGDIRLVEVGGHQALGDWRDMAGRRAYEAYNRELYRLYGDNFPVCADWDDLEGGAQSCWIAAATF